MLEVGIVGLPNVGKSTIFNALSHAHAKVSNFPFCTIEPNRAVAPIPDPRLDRLGDLAGQERRVPAQIEFVDIAGLVKGASKGEGLGNRFLGHIREVDALLHVVRCFSDANVAHVEDGVAPVRDVEIVETELLLADLETVEKRREADAPRLRAKEPEAVKEAPVLEKLADALADARPARSVLLHSDEAEIARGLHLLTAKPVLLLANAGEEGDDAAAAELQAYAAAQSVPVVVVKGRLEADLGEMEEAERAEFMRDLELAATGLDRVIRASFELLDLITFFTIVGKEVRAWTVPRGTRAREAAGIIHSDMEQGFVRAEVIGSGVLLECEAWEEAHRRGLVRTEGRDYALQDGDVVQIRFAA
jgi:GTP-binding protein YchF